MSKSQFGKDNLSAARQFLAEARAQAGIQGRKSVGEMQPKQVIRQANSFARQIQAGIEPNLPAARGHATTPERPGRAARPLPADVQQFTERRKQERATLPGNVKRFKTGSIDAPVRTKAQVRRVARATRGRQVKNLQYQDVNGKWHTRSLNLTTDELLEEMDAYDSFYDWLDSYVSEDEGFTDETPPTTNAAIFIA